MPWHNTRPRQRSYRAPSEFIDPCLPTKVDTPPAGDDWAHEIKHDGYRVQIHIGLAGVWVYTMSGYDWTGRYPRIGFASGAIGRAAIIDAEAVVQNESGITDFDAVHCRIRNAEVFAFGFDLLMLDGEDLSPRPWIERKRALSKLLGRKRTGGLVVNEHTIGRGPDVYAAACHMGLEGIVSKRIDAPYRSGKSSSWLKIKNPNAPGVTRFKEDTEG
jgi:bifunctional non-homologous end joining protein LigD